MSQTISDLSTEVILKCENRQTDLARAYIWLRDSILEISGNPDYRDEFAELEVLGPTFLLTASVQEYSESNLLAIADINLATLDILIWKDPPTNSVRQKLNPSNYQETDKSVVTVSTPVSWYRFGGNIGFYPAPDKSYQVQARVLRQHPINDVTLQATEILLPRDWNEILVYAAVERGYLEKGEFEKASGVHTLLYGDPKYPGKPGLVNGRKKKRAREAWRTSQGMRPIVGDYIHR